MRPHKPSTVALVTGTGVMSYPPPPYLPVTPPTEFPRGPIGSNPSNGGSGTDVYSMVREAFRLLDLDPARQGTSGWNPLSRFVEQGNTVLIKPNLVYHENLSGGGTECLVTHGSVLRPILDYVSIALNGTGRIIVGDAPVQSSDFGKLLAVSGIADLAALFGRTAPPVEVRDMRESVSHWNRLGLLAQSERQAGGNEESVRIDLGRQSALCPLDGGANRYRVTYYDSKLMAEHHHDGHHV